ncbi:MAG: hypothetical protein HPY82_05925 [Gammaproteobacteria bacterium]|nr:hypothetical protein [Gammaproteobacteria bacterium]
MSIFTNPDFQGRLKAALVYASEYIEADAECFRECSTVEGGSWLDADDQRQYELEKRKVAEISELLKLMHEGQDDE